MKREIKLLKITLMRLIVLFHSAYLPSTSSLPGKLTWPRQQRRHFPEIINHISHTHIHTLTNHSATQRTAGNSRFSAARPLEVHWRERGTRSEALRRWFPTRARQRTRPNRARADSARLGRRSCRSSLDRCHATTLRQCLWKLSYIAEFGFPKRRLEPTVNRYLRLFTLHCEL